MSIDTPATGADTADLALAWEQCYLEPRRAAEAGQRIAARGGALAPWGWLHVALAEARVGDLPAGGDALDHARAGFAASGDSRGLMLADEVQAIRLRRDGDAPGALALQQAIESRPCEGITPLDRFIAHNSRAITHKVLGHLDDALRHFYAAFEAAEASDNTGARITSMGNLGGYQQDLYNLDDARELCERALRAARTIGSPRNLATAANNLILIYWSLGEALRAREMTEFLLTHRDELPADVTERYRSALALGHLAVSEIDAAMAWLAPGHAGAVGDNDGMAFWTWLTMRCRLAQGDAAGARALGEQTLGERATRGLADSPFDAMELHRALADACEQLGDAVAALACARRAHVLYEQLVGRSARARRVALQIGFDLARAERERDLAVDSRRAVEADRERLAELNAALEAKIAENESLHDRLREQALRDPLTGLHNRRYLFEAAPAALELSRRQSRPLAVVLLDLDHFKLLNDTYGHAAGDRVLQRFGVLLAETLRKSDVICRHGGEEFVALMPDIDAPAAREVLQRLLEAYQQMPQEAGRRRLPRCTFSAGIAIFPRHGNTLEQLLSRADRALYRAKQQGRSRIEQAPGSMFSTLN